MALFFWISYGVLWLGFVILLLLMLIVFRQFGLVYLKTAGGVSRSGAAIGTEIPELEFDTVTGDHIRLADLRGRHALLVFTSPKCAPCRELLPDLAEFVVRYPGLTTLVFSQDATAPETLAFIQDVALRCAVIALPDRELYQTVFDGSATPFAFLLGRNLEVAAKGLVNDFAGLERVINPRSAAARRELFNELSQSMEGAVSS